MRQRVYLGRDVRAVGEPVGGIELEGRTRLRPGHDVDVVLPATGGSTPTIRRAVVFTWNVKRLGREGPTFRGICHWEA